MAHSEVHPTKVIKTDKGNIIMEKPNLLHTSALSNSIYTYILSDDDLLKLNEMTETADRDRFIQLKTLKKGYTTLQLSILSYVTSAPFHLNDYSVEPVLDLKSFLEFADAKLIAQMSDAIKELGMIDPLQP